MYVNKPQFSLSRPAIEEIVYVPESSNFGIVIMDGSALVINSIILVSIEGSGSCRTDDLHSELITASRLNLMLKVATSFVRPGSL